MRLTLKIVLAVAALAVLGPLQPAAAQGFGPDLVRDVIHACRADYHRICPDVIPGGGRVARCLSDHEEALSPPCLTAVKLAQAVRACAPDYFRFCPGVEPGGGRVAQCLADNLHDLEPACKRVVSANAPYAGQWEDELSKDGRSYADGRRDGWQDDRYAYRFGERRDYRDYPENERERRFDDEGDEPVK